MKKLLPLRDLLVYHVADLRRALDPDHNAMHRAKLRLPFRAQPQLRHAGLVGDRRDDGTLLQKR